MTAAGLLVLRLTVAIVLIAHGAHELFGSFAGPGVGRGGLTNAAAFVASIGLKPAFPLAVAFGSLQLAGGILLAVGWFTRPTAIVLAAYLAVMIFRDSARWGFFLNWMLDRTRGHGLEFTLLIAGGVAALALAGAGEWSIDGWRASTAQSRAAGRARLRRR
jgi:putative oxidoreductase